MIEMQKSFEAYKSHLSTNGTNSRDRTIRQAYEDFTRAVVDHPGYQEDSLRNGEPQRFFIQRDTTMYRADITAFPGEELYPGDMIECFGEHWICYQTRVASPIQVSGTLWLCNHLFRWQNGTPDVIERWGVLDSGVFSTTMTSGYEVNTPDVQYKIYLPLDDDTRKLFVDKRIATNVRYDANFKEILEVYRLTRVDLTSQAYGKGAHLMLLNARSDDYIAETDSLAERICDYIDPHESVGPLTPPDSDPALLDSTISGRTTVRIGGSRVYSTNIPTDAVWTYEPIVDGITLSAEGNAVRLAVDSLDELVGTVVTLSVCDAAGAYNPAHFDVEVIS